MTAQEFVNHIQEAVEIARREGFEAGWESCRKPLVTMDCFDVDEAYRAWREQQGNK